MIISAIVAVAENGVIGRNGHLPWHLGDDMHRFRFITSGHSVIIGRKNYEDIGHPLPNRINYVITHNGDYAAPGCIVCDSISNAIEDARMNGETECFIIGGGSIYDAAMPATDRIYLTRVMAEVDGDTRFSMPSGNWASTDDGFHPADENNDYPVRYQIWSRVADSKEK